MGAISFSAKARTAFRNSSCCSLKPKSILRRPLAPGEPQAASSPRKPWGALLSEGGRALQEVPRVQTQGLGVGLEVDGRLEVAVDVPLDRLLRQAQGYGRPLVKPL